MRAALTLAAAAILTAPIGDDSNIIGDLLDAITGNGAPVTAPPTTPAPASASPSPSPIATTSAPPAQRQSASALPPKSETTAPQQPAEARPPRARPTIAAETRPTPSAPLVTAVPRQADADPAGDEGTPVLTVTVTGLAASLVTAAALIGTTRVRAARKRRTDAAFLEGVAAGRDRAPGDRSRLRVVR